MKDKCGHGIALGSGECADCTGPMTEAELDLIRRRLAGHDGCVPRCDRAPSSETSRLLATIDALRVQQGAATQAFLARYEEMSNASLALANEIGAEQLMAGAETMRAACSSMLRRVEQLSMERGTVGGGALAAIAADHAKAIELLPLPEGGPVVMSPAKGALGRILYKTDGVMVCLVTLEPGAEWPSETHVDMTETVLVSKGRIYAEGAAWGSYDDGTGSRTFHDRDAIGAHAAFVASGAQHKFVNVGETQAEYISVMRRA